MTETKPLGLFERIGVEIEYMIVDRSTLAVRPITDKVIWSVAGEYLNEVERGVISWSNELVLHVIELKTTNPVPSTAGLTTAFQKSVAEINALLAPLDACLMPTAMHPWMDPFREMVLWPHDANEIYDAFNRIFNCQGHGWSNLQSAHLNLPFANDEEFARLHAAIRLVLPILPALAASSPVVEGRRTGLMDNRLEAYRTNSQRIPSITGRVIPEPVFSMAGYQKLILQRMFADIAPYDPEGVLQYEWLNARGAIARFERNTIEIRVLDTQECPEADLAIIEVIIALLKALTEERWVSLDEQKACTVESLETIFLQTVEDADAAVIHDPAYLRVCGLPETKACTAGELWRDLAKRLFAHNGISPALTRVLEHGSLARRIVEALNNEGSNDRMNAVYGELCACLAEGKMFLA
ncbi:MAG: glutamate--cysteine ligase [Candidatus Hydrogenedentes bacterium]|nr:glutamate--cysteine ligase [Candidatus Hydrogenedentota bacterium]